MTSIHADVSFPLSGSSTPALGDRFRLRLLHLGGTTIDKRWGRGDFVSPHWRVYLNLDDGAWVEVQGRRLPLIAGRLYVVPAWLHWAGGCSGRVRHLNALFDLPSAGKEAVSASVTGILEVGGVTSVLARRWLDFGLALASAENVTPVQVADGYALIYAVMSAVCQQLGATSERLLAPAGSGGLIPVLAAIEQHLAEALPVARLAKLAKCSPADLHRRFLAGVGVSPARWVRTRRIVLAADLLRSSELSITAIAQRSGFADRVRLSKVFAQHMGLGPAAWRRRETGL